MNIRSPLAALALFGLAACGGGSKTPPATVSTLPPNSAAEVDAILVLLDQGQAKPAKKRIAAGLKRDPMNASLLVLRDSIDGDPKELLGPTSWSYTVRPGETMTDLAQRFLGNRLKAYQLARYNGVERPAAIVAGQALRIPGSAPRVEAPRREEVERPAPRAKSVAVKPVVSKLPPAPPVRAANPAAARQARAAGLAALNQGKVVLAVTQLRRAAALDPANPLIARDRARAERIAATVRARK